MLLGRKCQGTDKMINHDVTYYRDELFIFPFANASILNHSIRS